LRNYPSKSREMNRKRVMKMIKRITSIAVSLLVLLSVLTSISWYYAPPTYADSPVLKWNLMETPGSTDWKNDIVSPSEVNRMAAGYDGKTFYCVDIPYASNIDGSKALYRSDDGGYSWDDNPGIRLFYNMTFAEQANFHVWDVAVAKDNVNIIAAVTNNQSSPLPRNVWVSIDSGVNWQNTHCPAVANISSIDMSNSSPTLFTAVGTRTGTGNGTIYILEAPVVINWVLQPFTGDVLALKFSPNHQSDSTITVVYSDASGTFLNAGYHDTAVNTTEWNSIYGAPVEITDEGPGFSPKADEIISADLDMSADFNGQSPSYRHFYISTDSLINDAGIFRIDDSVVYQLMTATPDKRISSISYYGTYGSGKLLAGEVLGKPCEASVMTWFTDAPMTCPVSCWYPAKKPPTGAAGTIGCTGSRYGNAQVVWSTDGTTVYSATSSTEPLIPGPDWALPYLAGQELDESSFSLSKNNGATWNQIALIDTAITRYIDLAPAGDCSYMYLASVNTAENCAGFDSVWRSQYLPEGHNWERVLCRPTSAEQCVAAQSDNAILRLTGDKTDGQVVFWAARDSYAIWWSPDYGDFWFTINSRLKIQDFTAEDSRTLYVLDSNGLVQRINYVDGGWKPSREVHSCLTSAYSIATAYTETTPDNPLGIVIVGGTVTSGFNVAFSLDGAENFNAIVPELPTQGNNMVLASSSFTSDGTILTINSGGMYAWSVYSNETEWETWWGGSSWPSPVTGFTISRNYSQYFNTPASLWSPATPYVRWSAATADLDPAISLGNPDEPDRRIRICGGLEVGSPITVYVIDQRDFNPPDGGVWFYIDTLVWEGPLLKLPISFSPVKYDPVTGRASEINLTWKPVSLSQGYRIQISKDFEFTEVIADIGRDYFGPFYVPFNFDSPSLIIPPGGGTITDAMGNTWNVPSLEAGHPYYWRAQVEDVLTGDDIKSPWSWVESFIIMQGLPVASPMLGPQILQPATDSCWACNTPVCFSWTPIMNTDNYRLELSPNADMSNPLVDVTVEGTGYQYSGNLQITTTYFWRVKAEEPHDGEWSATACFKINK
jgi:hypothetical protein